MPVSEVRSAARHTRWIVLAALLVASITCLLGEKIDIQGGFGWDGANYGTIAKDVYDELVVRGREAVTIRRVAPSLVAYAVLRPFVWPIENVHVIRFFIVANVLGISLACWLVTRTLDLLGAGPRTKWVAFSALILNFCVAKWFAYYPVLTDMPGFVLGAAMIYAVVRRSRLLLYVLTFLAAFTWPAAYYQGLILTVWDPFRTAQTPDRPGYPRLALVAASLLTLGFVGWASYLMRPEIYPAVKYNAQDPLYSVIWLAIALGAAYVFFGAWFLARPSLGPVLRTLPRVPLHWNTWLAALMLVVAVQAIVRQMASAETVFELDVYPHMVVSGIFRPGIFFLSHAVFFGPIVILAAFAWRRVCQIATDLGPGVALALGLMLLLAIGSESRREVNFLPMLVVLTVMALDLERWSWRAVAGFGVLCAVTSKLWLTIGPLGRTDNLEPRLFMHIGPWMLLDAYLVQLAGLVVVTALLALLVWRGRMPRPRLSTVIR